jgi:hypothetical protein
MKGIFSIVAVALCIAATQNSTFAQQSFSTEQTAQRHCPSDTVVWLNIPTHIYHLRGMRWYGATKNGVFVCEREADKAGDRETHNGQ